MKACYFDVCHINKVMGCASLQAYADECAMAGVCVDWRNATDGVCGQYINILKRSQPPLSFSSEHYISFDPFRFQVQSAAGVSSVWTSGAAHL